MKTAYFRYRATAYEGEYLGHGTPMTLISEISGGGWVGCEDSAPYGPIVRFLSAVRVLMQRRSASERPIEDATPMKSLMTVNIYRLGEMPDADELIARFDTFLGDGWLHASAHIVGLPRDDLGPFHVEPIGGVWETVINCLPC